MAKRDSLCWYLDLYKIDIIDSTLLCSLHQLNSNKNVKLEIQRNPWGIWTWTSITPVLLMENWIGKGWHSFFLPPTPKVIILFINKNKTTNRGEKKNSNRFHRPRQNSRTEEEGGLCFAHWVYLFFPAIFERKVRGSLQKSVGHMLRQMLCQNLLRYQCVIRVL